MWQPAQNLALNMESIPEESMDGVSPRNCTVTSVLHETYRSERVDSSRRTVAEQKLSGMDPRNIRPEEFGPPVATSSSYAYSYESHYDTPPPSNGHTPGMESNAEIPYTTIDDMMERRTVQMQKVTRTSKVTTTRTVEQIPHYDSEQVVYGEDGQYANFYGYDETNTMPLAVQEQQPEEFISQYDVPTQCGVPQVVDVDTTMVTLIWLPPDYEGDRGPVQGYVIECRQPSVQSVWQPAHTGLLPDTQVTIYNLEPNADYEFRVVARNPVGFGPPSTASPVVQLRPKFGHAPPGALSSHRPTPTAVPYPPGRPQVIEIDGTACTISWEPPIASGEGGPVAGYHVEYRPCGPGTASDWMLANDRLVHDNTYTIRGLRPNGEYEFRVIARNADGFSEPSQSTGPARMRPLAPPRSSPNIAGGVSPSGYIPATSPRGHGVPMPPSQPQLTDVDSTSCMLLWAPPHSPRTPGGKILGYQLEYREIGDPEWFSASDRLISDNQFIVNKLHPNSTYEFRVFAKNVEGWSEPSEVSEIVQLRPKSHGLLGPRSVPGRPAAPEIMEVGADSVTLCWPPAPSNLPVQGYQLELRDYAVAPNWQQVNDILTNQCKLTVTNLTPGHQYEFRVIAKNPIGYSEPSAPSEAVVCGRPDVKASMQAVTAVPLQREQSFLEPSAQLPDELKLARESPPISDRDDSPPPLRRNPPISGGQDGVTWRDPTLPEVLEYLSHPNDNIKLNASGYLQHLTYHDDVIKQKARELGAIPKLIGLLNSVVPDIQRNAAGCLRNLSYGKRNEENKQALFKAGGIPALSNTLRRTNDHQVIEEVTGALWNLSSVEELKRPILEHAFDPLVTLVVIPYSGYNSSSNHITNGNNPSESIVFRNAAGILMNVSSAGEPARRMLRDREHLVDCLMKFTRDAVMNRKEFEGKTLENVVCILRNLSYKCQEIIDPDYDKKPVPGERSKSAPSGSPKAKAKNKMSKRKSKEQLDTSDGVTPWYLRKPHHGVASLWDPEVVKIYLALLQESSNSETLEAAAGAIQNLAACYWQPSIDIRAAVRKEKGLPVLVELLRIEVDRVFCAVATALRNLALDPRNRELIGNYAMRDLVRKLPTPSTNPEQYGAPPPAHQGTDDDTLAAVLGVVYETVSRSAQFAKSFHEAGGTGSLVYITRSRGRFSPRVVKYSSQVLFHLWQHRELHELYKRQGFKESDFVTRTMASRGHGTDTLSKPISSQGDGRYDNDFRSSTSRLRPDLRDDYGSRSRLGSASQPPVEEMRAFGFSNGGGSGNNTPYGSEPSTGRLQQQHMRPDAAEPLYAIVQKPPRGEPPLYAHSNGSSRLEQPAGDSWV